MIGNCDVICRRGKVLDPVGWTFFLPPPALHIMIMFDVMNDVENSILPFPTTTTTHYVCLPPMRFCFKPLYPVLPDARNNFTWNYFLVSFRLIEIKKPTILFLSETKSQPCVNKETTVFTYPKKNLLIIRLRSSTRLILKSTSRWLIFCIVYLVT